MTDRAGVWSLAIPVLSGTALRVSLCSGAPPSIWKRLSQDWHCSPKLLLLSPPSCASLFPGFRSALWSEGFLPLLLLFLPFMLHDVIPQIPCNQISSWHLLHRGLKLMHPLGSITGNYPTSEIRGSDIPLSDHTSNPAGLHTHCLLSRGSYTC